MDHGERLLERHRRRQRPVRGSVRHLHPAHVHGELQIVEDTTAASGSLGIGIVCHTNCRRHDPDSWPTRDEPIRHVLLRQSSGAYILAVWSESKVWDPGSRADTPKPPQGFTLHLRSAPARIELFDPASGPSTIRTDTSGARIFDTVAPDALRLSKITPGAEHPSRRGATASHSHTTTTTRTPAAIAACTSTTSSSTMCRTLRGAPSDSAARARRLVASGGRARHPDRPVSRRHGSLSRPPAQGALRARSTA